MNVDELVDEIVKRTEEYHLEWEILWMAITYLVDETELAFEDISNLLKKDVYCDKIDIYELCSQCLSSHEERGKDLLKLFKYLISTNKVTIEQLKEALYVGFSEWDV